MRYATFRNILLVCVCIPMYEHIKYIYLPICHTSMNGHVFTEYIKVKNM